MEGEFDRGVESLRGAELNIRPEREHQRVDAERIAC
jgi:hypothetical protein